MKKQENKKQSFSFNRLWDMLVRTFSTMGWQLVLIIIGIIVVSGVLTLVFSGVILFLFGWVPALVSLRLNPFFSIGVLLSVGVIVSIPISIVMGMYYLRPLKVLIAATKEVKRGNFNVRIATKTPSKPQNKTEMDLLIENFNEMVGELGGIELFRNDFINNFSHEFKTPIVSIRGFARELQRGDLTEAQRIEYATIIAEESDRLAKLSSSVLELSKLENQQIVSDKTEFELDEQLRQCILLQESSWSEKGIDMIPELEDVLFFGNEEMLALVWRNLIGNAIKFTPKDGAVTVRLTADDANVTVSVSDTGIGMSEEEQRHIFEKFYQGDKSHSRAGYGIGLTVVSRVVKLCEGTLTVESELGKGSTFTVTLPRASIK